VVGVFFAALSLALAAAVLASLVIALTVIPLLASRLLAPAAAPAPASSTEPAAGGHAPDRLGARYGRLLRRALTRRAAAVVLALLVAAGGFGAAAAAEPGFTPERDEGAFVLDYIAPIGTSLPEADKLAGEIDRMLAADPAVATFTRRLGAELG